MNIIEMLWNGDINPLEYCPPDDDERQEVKKHIKEVSAAFEAHLTEEQKKQFEQCNEARVDLYALNECDAFVRGFRLGMKIAVEALFGDGSTSRF